MKTLEIIVKGYVQGVGYRYFTYRQAHKYNIKGYVKNLPNGNVLVIAQGEECDFEAFIEQLKIGPISSKVNDITIKTYSHPLFDTFSVKLS